MLLAYLMIFSYGDLNQTYHRVIHTSWSKNQTFPNATNMHLSGIKPEEIRNDPLEKVSIFVENTTS
jgi:hypothetical protein